MEKRLLFWELGGFLFTGAAGTLLRSAYGWLGNAAFAAPFAAVNGSLWEEMKALFVPVFLLSLVEIILLAGECPRLPGVRGASVLFGLGLIPVLCYTYTGVLGYSLPWADKALFWLADLGLFWMDYRLLRRSRRAVLWRQVLGLAVLWGLAFAFVWCTFRPPDLALWRDSPAGAPEAGMLAASAIPGGAVLRAFFRPRFAGF